MICVPIPGTGKAIIRTDIGDNTMSFPVICETIMLVCFGFSWPAMILKSLRSRTAKGKSLSFLLLVEIGYLFGIIGKIITHTYNLATFFYFINFFMVLTDILLYFRNVRLDRERESKSS